MNRGINISSRGACPLFRQAVGRRFSKLTRLNRDQDGSISIATVFAVLALTMLLGMLMNVGRQVDGKIRMQNAADAAAYSGGVVIARGMNTLTFTNHLLFEVFSLTAFMREANEQNAARYVPEILDAWGQVAPQFANSPFPPFAPLADAIPDKLPLEQQLVDTYSAWLFEASALILPEMEYILANELIPTFQRDVVLFYPEIAQMAAMESARRNGVPRNNRDEMLGVLWRSNGTPVAAGDGTLAAVDPTVETSYLSRAVKHRNIFAKRYLGVNRRSGWRWTSQGWRNRPWWYVGWNDVAMVWFDTESRMGAFAWLWRNFTCGQLEKLFREYPTSNLPHLIRGRALSATNNAYLDEHFHFLGVVYWKQIPEMAPGVFINPTDSDPVAYAEVRVLIPRRRLAFQWLHPGASLNSYGGAPGNMADFPDAGSATPDEPERIWRVGRQSERAEWSLLNQRWTVQLVPTTQAVLPGILQTVPPLPEFGSWDFTPPDLGSLNIDDIQTFSPH